ncbi:MAG TPA: hypothetical protein VKC51_08110 [Lacunisphaera sp.]|nr:hypothetical protein [Lacunisphaera sp.]
MKHNNIPKTLILAAAMSLGLAASAVAADTPVPVSGNMGLLGQTYADLTYSYINLDASSSHADDYHFEYNQPLNAGFDGVLAYDWTQTGSFAKQQSILAALRAFNTSFKWGKPYVEAGGGYAWNKVAGVKDNSFLWEVTVGAEFQVAPAVTVTPFVQYLDAPDLASRSTWNYGVNANYWIDSQWAVTGGISRNDNQDTAFTVGTNFRF